MKNQLVPRDFFTALPFWTDLSKEEQVAIEQHTKGLANAFAGVAVLRTEIGGHLAAVEPVLKAQKGFTAYLRALFPTRNPIAAERMAYRYIEAYKKVQSLLPHPQETLQMAAARGIDLVGYQGNNPFGAYSKPIAQLPPPKDVAGLPKWLDEIEEKRKKMPKKGRGRRAVVDPDAEMIKAFRVCSAAYKNLDGGRGRHKWAVKLIGILMGEFGLPAQTVQPEAVPEGFRAVLGRPKLKEETGSAAAD